MIITNIQYVLITYSHHHIYDTMGLGRSTMGLGRSITKTFNNLTAMVLTSFEANLGNPSALTCTLPPPL